MVSNKHTPAPVIAFFETRKFLGTRKYIGGDIPGRSSTFSGDSNDADVFEELMEVQTVCFNDIISGANIDNIDFSKLIVLLNELHPKYNGMKNFLLDTLTIVNSARLYKLKAANLAQQLEVLQDEYEELLGKYQWLEEHCGEIEEEKDSTTNLTFCTNVQVDMDIVYTLYQHFFGYPDDGIWDEEKANMIRRHLQNRTITEFKEDGSRIKIRHQEDYVKVILAEAPSSELEIKVNEPALVGDTIVYTNCLEVNGKTENDFGLKIGQQITIGYGGPNPEIRYIVGLGSLILNKPLNNTHPEGSSIVIAGQDGKYKFLNGKIIKVNGKFESYDIELEIGGILLGVREIYIEDGKRVDPCPHDDYTFDNIETSHTCTKCGDIIYNL